MAYIDFITPIHTQTKRDYLKRVTDYPKAQASIRAKKFGEDYFDGDRKFGYGGHYYDGRWQPVAEQLIHHYGLKSKHKVLDIGCGKGFLIYDLLQIIPDLEIYGLDVSSYALEHAKKEIKENLILGNATKLPFKDHTFDLVLSINALHNLRCYDLERGLKEIERVKKKYSYIVVDSYRNENEKVNLLYWQLTCECFYSVKEWQWWFDFCRYTGDYSFVFFE